MRISYNKLWKRLIDKNMKKIDLKEKMCIRDRTNVVQNGENNFNLTNNGTMNFNF